MTNNNLRIIDKVLPNEKIEHEGYLIVKGNVGEDAQVKVKYGQLIVRGNVAKDARLKAEGAYIPTENDGRENILVEGALLSQKFQKVSAKESRIVIQGRVESHAVLVSSGNIFVGKSIEDCAHVISGGVVNAKDVGELTEIIADGDVKLRDVNKKSQVSSLHGNVDIREVKAAVNGEVKIEAADTLTIQKVSSYFTKAVAGREIRIEESTIGAMYVAPSVQIKKNTGSDFCYRPVKINPPITKF